MKIHVILEWDHGELMIPEIAFETKKMAKDYTKDLHFSFCEEIELKEDTMGAVLHMDKKKTAENKVKGEDLKEEMVRLIPLLKRENRELRAEIKKLKAETEKLRKVGLLARIADVERNLH